MTEFSERQNIRIPVRINVTLRFAKHTYENCSTRDLCLKGLWVHGCQEQKIGDLCEVELYEKEVPINRSFNIRGEIVRVNPDGIAIQFTDMNTNSYRDLQTLLIYRSDDPLLVAEEFLDEFIPKKKP